jgi:DNA-binding SARP family transcriptional activator
MPSTPEAGALAISLLGGFQARVDASTIHLPTRKTQGLLAYLALHAGQPHDREKLQGLLWPDAASRQAQASLRQTLFTLRKTLPRTSSPALLTTTTTVALDASRLWVDVAVLERHVGGATREALEGVASLYAGDLLEELVRMRILTGTGDAFHFTHARVREVICWGLSSQRRKVLEDAVAHGRAYFLEEYRRRGWDR